MLIQELGRQDRILYSVGVKLVGSRLDQVDLEKEFYKKISVCVQYVQIIVKVDSIDKLKFAHSSLKFVDFGFGLTGFGFHVKNIDRYILHV